MCLEKIRSGVFGLNPLLDGGINARSAVVIIGSPGTGKTTFATQFIKRGLENNEPGIFVSLDENQDQIIKEAKERGWAEISDFIDDGLLLFIDASGQEFSTFISEELPGFVSEWEGARARIAIDPLTPVMWAIEERYNQRELLSFLLKEMKKIGTVVCTLEEHGTVGDLSGNEIVIPMYLADCVVHLKYIRTPNVPDSSVKRALEIVKCRNSRHSKLFHPYRIIHGFGIMIQQNLMEINDSTEIPDKIKNELWKGKRVSKTLKKRIERYLDELRDEDFEEMDTSIIMANIMDEYL
jgi:KaiC/GvpD/RAD55 family RecA-like ATPase